MASTYKIDAEALRERLMSAEALAEAERLGVTVEDLSGLYDDDMPIWLQTDNIVRDIGVCLDEMKRKGASLADFKCILHLAYQKMLA